METENAVTANVQTELTRRHKATSTTVVSLLVAVVLLSILAFVSQKFLTPRNSSIGMPALITIFIFGVGAIAFRRTKFAAMRLQDIAALRGASGLLISLQRTTLQVALIGAAVAVIGFVTTLLTADPSYTYRGTVVAAAVLLYGYPVRTSWEQAVRRFAPENGPKVAENPS